MNGVKKYCQPLAFKTKSGMNIEVWFSQALKLYEQWGIKSGPIFHTVQGKQASVGDLDVQLRMLFKKSKWTITLSYLISKTLKAIA